MSVLRTSTGEAIPLAELPSACTTPGHSAAERVDLFWSGVRSAGTGQVAISWTSRTSLDRYRSAGIAHPGSRIRWSQEAALAKVRDDPTRLQALGALHLWRTMTSEQVAAVIGSPLTSSPRSVDLALLFAAGLAQRGMVFAAERRAIAPMLWRPDIAARALRFEDRLSYAEWLGVYAGQEWSWGAQAGRHNLITTELSLRVAEYTPIGAVLGELLAGARLLFPTQEQLARSRRSADAVWVRDDGLRIVVEATATATTTFRARLEHWIKLLLQDAERSTVVLFVDVSDPDNDRSRPDLMMRRGIVDAVTASPERVEAGIPSRVAFARYRDWFPDLGLVHPSFFGLQVERPTGRPGARFEPVDLLDPYAVPFAPADPEAARAPIVHAGNLYGVPHWLRGPGLDLDAVVRRLAGFPPPEVMPPERRAELVERFARRADPSARAQSRHGDDPPASLSTDPRRPRPLALGRASLGSERRGS